MFLRRTLTLMVVTAALIASAARAQHIVPSALLTIDQNRATVVERIVGEWGDRLATSNASVSTAQLREILSGLRSDHLLAASLAGSVEGLRDVVSAALVRSDVAVATGLMHTKALGDTTFDLVYTPVVPCRIVDTRSGGGGVFAPQTQRNWRAFSILGFASQGGSATNCGIPLPPVAIMANTTLADTVGGPEFFTLWPFGQTRPNASTVNWWASAQQPANAEIVPLCTGAGCTADFSAFASGQTHAIIDVLGYFNRPANYGGTHTITGFFAADSGGYSNMATGNYSTVSGGESNSAGGDYSAIAGGQHNFISGNSAFVAGGASNTADGTASFAAGTLAKAYQNGEFTWGDQTQQVFNPGDSIHNQNGLWWANPTNTFNARASGGVMFVTGVDGSGYPLTGITAGPGSGTWASHSDRNIKENFSAIDPQMILNKVARLPIASWNYIAEGAKVRHLGPVSQDFHAAFGLGANEYSIAVVDADGIALAAIQGLHRLLQEKDRKIARLEARAAKVDTLERKLQAIEVKLGIR